MLSAVVAAILIFDAAVKLLDDDAVLCKTDTDRVMYLKTQGLVDDPTPLWVKQTVLGGSWAEYAKQMSGKVEDYLGSSVTLYCYPLKQGADADCVRVVCCGDEVVGFDLSDNQKVA